MKELLKEYDDLTRGIINDSEVGYFSDVETIEIAILFLANEVRKAASSIGDQIRWRETDK